MTLSDEAIITMPKFYDGELAYEAKQNNKAFKIISFRPEDDIGATIPGLTIEICLRVPRAVNDCKYTFTLFSLRGRRRERIYQLEVVPAGKKSHNGPPKLYGPHVHAPDGVYEVGLDLCCEDYQDWMAWFCQEVNLQLATEPPTPFGRDDGLQLAND